MLDSGAVTFMADGSSSRARALIAVFGAEGLWPPVVPSVVLAECLTGRPDRDARINRFLKGCNVEERLSMPLARRAARLRADARRGSAVDAIVVASAEPDGTVATGDVRDIGALAATAARVTIEPV